MSTYLQLGVGFAVLLVIFDRVTAFALKMQARREVRKRFDGDEVKSPEVMLAEALGELKTVRELFVEHDEADREAFARIERALERGDSEVMAALRELRAEFRAAHSDHGGRISMLERKVAVLEDAAGKATR